MCNSSFELLLGIKTLDETINNRKFSLFPSSYYPRNFIAYANFLSALAEQVSRANRELTNQIVVELDEPNGFLGALIQKDCKKFYSIQHHLHNRENIQLNLKQNGCLGLL